MTDKQKLQAVKEFVEKRMKGYDHEDDYSQGAWIALSEVLDKIKELEDEEV